MNEVFVCLFDYGYGDKAIDAVYLNRTSAEIWLKVQRDSPHAQDAEVQIWNGDTGIQYAETLRVAE